MSLTAIGAQPARADADVLCTDAYMDRGRESYDVLGTIGASVPDQHQAGRTSLVFRKGDKVTFPAVTGEVWAGVWFTPPNGPRGWEGWAAPQGWPAPGENQFALIGQWLDVQTLHPTPFLIGTGDQCFRAPDRPSWLRLLVNDNDRVDNEGAFHVTLQVWKALPWHR